MSNRRRPRRERETRYRSRTITVGPRMRGLTVHQIIDQILDDYEPERGILSAECLSAVSAALLCHESPTSTTTVGEVEDLVMHVSALVHDTATDMLRAGAPGSTSGREAVLLAAARAAGSGGLS